MSSGSRVCSSFLNFFSFLIQKPPGNSCNRKVFWSYSMKKIARMAHQPKGRGKNRIIPVVTLKSMFAAEIHRLIKKRRLGWKKYGTAPQKRRRRDCSRVEMFSSFRHDHSSATIKTDGPCYNLRLAATFQNIFQKRKRMPRRKGKVVVAKLRFVVCQ